MLRKIKAQGLAIRVIILAVIGLIVLVVVIAIFTKESSKTVETLGSCALRGGGCKDDCSPGKIMPGIECEEEDDICCYGSEE